MNTIDEASPYEPAPSDLLGNRVSYLATNISSGTLKGLKTNGSIALSQSDFFDDPVSRATDSPGQGSLAPTPRERPTDLAVHHQTNAKIDRPVANESAPDKTTGDVVPAADVQQTRTEGKRHAERPGLDLAINLDSIMPTSQISEESGRHRIGLSNLVGNFQRLVGASWTKAADRWEHYRTKGEQKTSLIGIDENGSKTSVGTSQDPHFTFPSEAHESAKPGTAELGEIPAAAPTEIPASVRKRYLIAENRFYFRDDPNLIAFEDKGKRLATEHNDPVVARSMIELAVAKNWSAIKVSGTDEFRREVWLAASTRNIGVRGYEPRAIDLAKLEELRNEFRTESKNSIQQDVQRERPITPPERPAPANKAPAKRAIADIDNNFRNLTKQQRVALATLRAILTERGDSAAAIDMTAQLAAKRFMKQRVYVGRMLDHGAAPYENREDESPNYFVKLKTANGERTIWGVDLERGIADGRLQRGDDLVLIHLGRKPVTVATRERDESGAYTGRQVEAVVDRNTWEIGKLDKLREAAQRRAIEAERHAEINQPVVRFYETQPHAKHTAVERENPRPVEIQPQR